MLSFTRLSLGMLGIGHGKLWITELLLRKLNEVTKIWVYSK